MQRHFDIGLPTPTLPWSKGNLAAWIWIRIRLMRASVKGETSIPIIDKVTKCDMNERKKQKCSIPRPQNHARSMQQWTQLFSMQSAIWILFQNWNSVLSAETFLNPLSTLDDHEGSDHKSQSPINGKYSNLWADQQAYQSSDHRNTKKIHTDGIVKWLIIWWQWTWLFDRAHCERSEKVWYV